MPSYYNTYEYQLQRAGRNYWYKIGYKIGYKILNIQNPFQEI